MQTATTVEKRPTLAERIKAGKKVRDAMRHELNQLYSIYDRAKPGERKQHLKD